MPLLQKLRFVLSRESHQKQATRRSQLLPCTGGPLGALSSCRQSWDLGGAQLVHSQGVVHLAAELEHVWQRGFHRERGGEVLRLILEHKHLDRQCLALMITEPIEHLGLELKAGAAYGRIAIAKEEGCFRSGGLTLRSEVKTE